MKKLIIMTLITALVVGLVACQNKSVEENSKEEEKTQEEVQEEKEEAQEETEEESTEDEAAELAGGWTILTGQKAQLPEEVQEAFDKAMEGFVGSNVTPVAFIAQQVVAGMNYMILCECETVTQNPEVSYQMVVIYRNLDGDAEISGMKDFNVSDYTETEGNAATGEVLAGGWSVPEEYTVIDLPAEAKEAFEKATEGLTGNDLIPMACLGTQVVAGTNYAILCHSTLTTKDPITSIQLVTVYADLDGNAEVLNICTIDPADFNE